MGLEKSLILVGEEHGSPRDANIEAEIILKKRPSYIISEPSPSIQIKNAAGLVGCPIEEYDLELDDKKDIMYYITSKGLDETRKQMANKLVEKYKKSDGPVVGIFGAGHLGRRSELLKTLQENGITYEIIMRDSTRLISSLLEHVSFFGDVFYKIKHGQ